MSKVVLDMSISLDGIGAGPNPSEQDRMGAGGVRLHEWMPFYADGDPTAGIPAGSEADARMVGELLTATGAVVLGKRTFDLGLEPWGGTPFPVPCFVLTHRLGMTWRRRQAPSPSSRMASSTRCARPNPRRATKTSW